MLSGQLSIRRVLAILATSGLCMVSLLWLVGKDAAKDVAADTIELVSFSVRDETGRFVSDLTAEDCEVIESGLPKSLLSLTRHFDGRATSNLGRASDDGGSAAVRDREEAVRRLVAVVIDDLSFSEDARGPLLDSLAVIRETLIQSGTVFAVVPTGPVRTIVDLTYDLSRFDAVIRTVSTTALSAAPGNAVDGDRGRVARETLRELLTALTRLKDQRKAVLFITNGHHLPQNSRSALESLRGQDVHSWTMTTPQADGKGDPVAALKNIVISAGRANATINVIRLVEPRPTQAPQQRLTTLASPPVTLAGTESAGDIWLQTLADRSGGFYTTGDRPLADVLGAVDRHLTEYYVLTYESTSTRGDELRRLELKVRRLSTTVAYRPWR